jgi:hypothetical protein
MGEGEREKPVRPEADATSPEKAPKAKVAARGKGARAAGKADARASGALDANAKRIADRKSHEAEIKKRAERRREGEKARPKTVARPTAPNREAPALAGIAPAAPVALPVRPAVAAPSTAEKTLRVKRYLTITDARKITGEATLSVGKPLAGIEAGARYNSAYFAPQLRSEFGVSLQVWKERIRRDANDRYNKAKRDYPNAEETTAVAPKAIFSYFGKIMTLTFADLAKSLVVSVSCGDTVCSPDELVSLAKLVRGRI